MITRKRRKQAEPKGKRSKPRTARARGLRARCVVRFERLRADVGGIAASMPDAISDQPGTSVVEQVDPVTGSHSAFITGLKTAIDVLPVKEKGNTDYLVLQHASIGPFFGGPGLVLRFASPSGSPVLVANCLTLPTSMTLDQRTGTLYVSELGGNIVAIPVP